jgi:uncharacterized protein
MGMQRPAFHLAFAVHDLARARQFYVGLLGCTEGRSSDDWVDFDFHGHQIVAHRITAAKDAGTDPSVGSQTVDGDQVPIPHFGLVLPWNQWEGLIDRIRRANIAFLIEPRLRFEGSAGEQGTLFLRDPSGNALEFKAFRDPQALFQRDDQASDPRHR